VIFRGELVELKDAELTPTILEGIVEVVLVET
jgi:hypothetical protein